MRILAGKTYKTIDFLLFIMPAFVLIMAFMGIPLFMSFTYAFTKWDGMGAEPVFVGLDNFINIFSTDINFWNSGLFTIKFTVVNMLFVNSIALGLALLLTSKIPFKGIFRVSFFIPNVLSTVIVAFIWRFIFREGSGALFEFTGLTFFNTSWLSNPHVVFFSFVFVEVWRSVGFFMIIFIAGLQSIPRTLYEASMIDGAGKWINFRKITLPMLAPALTSTIFFSLINSLKVFDLVFGLTQGGPGRVTESVAFNIYKTGFSERNFGLATAKGLLLFFFIFAVTLIQLRYSKSREIDL